jgi:hypothetical protein
MWMQDPLDRLEASLGESIDKFEIAGACLRFSYELVGNSMGFDATDPRITAQCNDFVRIVNEGNAPFLIPDEVAQLIGYIKTSKTPALAARAAAIALAGTHFENFGNALSQHASEHALKPLDCFPVYPKACRRIYGGERKLTMFPGDTRNRYDASRIAALALWTGDAPINVVLDIQVGAYIEKHLFDGKEFRHFALIQPNEDVSELSMKEVLTKTRRFFGVSPRNSRTQERKILKALHAADSETVGVSVAILPELCATEKIAEAIKSMQFGNIKMIVAGSYHATTVNGSSEIRRNTAEVIFPGKASFLRRHHKSGAFEFEMTGPLRHAMKLKDLSSMDGERFTEDIEPSRELRIFIGPSLSIVALICADLLDAAIDGALASLRPSLLLVASMTPATVDFVNIARGLVASGRTTTVMVNNPRTWPSDNGLAAVESVLCIAPVADQGGGVRAEPMPPGKSIAIVDLPTLSIGYL